MTMNNTSDAWRLDVNSHPLEYVNDGDVGTFWVSTALQQISLTITFGDIFQVLAIPTRFISLNTCFVG